MHLAFLTGDGYPYNARTALCATYNAEGDSWTLLGGASPTSNNASWADLAFDSLGIPYMAHGSATTREVTLWRFTADAWVQVGGE